MEPLLARSKGNVSPCHIVLANRSILLEITGYLTSKELTNLALSNKRLYRYILMALPASNPTHIELRRRWEDARRQHEDNYRKAEDTRRKVEEWLYATAIERFAAESERQVLQNKRRKAEDARREEEDARRIIEDQKQREMNPRRRREEQEKQDAEAEGVEVKRKVLERQGGSSQVADRGHRTQLHTVKNAENQQSVGPKPTKVRAQRVDVGAPRRQRAQVVEPIPPIKLMSQWESWMKGLVETKLETVRTLIACPQWWRIQKKWQDNPVVKACTDCYARGEKPTEEQLAKVKELFPKFLRDYIEDLRAILVGWDTLSAVEFTAGIQHDSPVIPCVFDEWLSDVSRGLVILCGKDPKTATVDCMEREVNERFCCCLCIDKDEHRARSIGQENVSVLVFTWRSAISHAREEHYKPDKPTHTMFRLLRDLTMKNLQAKVDHAEYWARNPRVALCNWFFAHCPNGWRREFAPKHVHEMMEHFSESHRDIADPKAHEDYILDEHRRPRYEKAVAVKVELTELRRAECPRKTEECQNPYPKIKSEIDAVADKIHTFVEIMTLEEASSIDDRSLRIASSTRANTSEPNADSLPAYSSPEQHSMSSPPLPSYEEARQAAIESGPAPPPGTRYITFSVIDDIDLDSMLPPEIVSSDSSSTSDVSRDSVLSEHMLSRLDPFPRGEELRAAIRDFQGSHAKIRACADTFYKAGRELVNSVKRIRGVQEEWMEMGLHPLAHCLIGLLDFADKSLPYYTFPPEGNHGVPTHGTI
ncbi:hypothetical protein NMY22_g7234 [Coprinellus aureogranulatus]|nr:hypothetical protein NMY22_g7234 [Coprinellus aureogranulatus]